MNWVVPPPMLMVVRKIENDQCNCTFVVPEWKSAPFWAMLIDMKGNFNTYVKTHSKMHNVYAIYRGRENNGIFGKRNLAFNMIILKIEF